MEPHLGGVLAVTDKLQLEFINKRIKGCQSICFAIQSLGSSRVPVNPVVANKLYDTVCLSKLCYGMELMDLDTDTIVSLEQCHSHNAKVFQGLPQQTANIGGLRTIGWKSILCKLEQNRLMFMWKILMLPTTNLYKRLLVRRIVQLVNDWSGRGPIWQCLQTCDKYNILDDVVQCVLEGDYPSINEFRKNVKQAISEKYEKSWRMSCIMYKSVAMLHTKDGVKMSVWWTHANQYPEDYIKCRLMIRLILDVWHLGRELCKLCNGYFANSLEHILFDCKSMEAKRANLWTVVELECPGQLSIELLQMNVKQRCRFILNGLLCEYIHEWYAVNTSLLHFVHGLYYDYYNTVKELD